MLVFVTSSTFRKILHPWQELNTCPNWFGFPMHTMVQKRPIHNQCKHIYLNDFGAILWRSDLGVHVLISNHTSIPILISGTYDSAETHRHSLTLRQNLQIHWFYLNHKTKQNIWFFISWNTRLNQRNHNLHGGRISAAEYIIIAKERTQRWAKSRNFESFDMNLQCLYIFERPPPTCIKTLPASEKFWYQIQNRYNDTTGCSIKSDWSLIPVKSRAHKCVRYGLKVHCVSMHDFKIFGGSILARMLYIFLMHYFTHLHFSDLRENIHRVFMKPQHMSIDFDKNHNKKHWILWICIKVVSLFMGSDSYL